MARPTTTAARPRRPRSLRAHVPPAAVRAADAGDQGRARRRWAGAADSMDAADDLAAGPVALIVDPALNLNNPNNDTQTAGVTFVGQFLDHDMTFDTTSRLGKPANPRRSPNARRPFFDLDSVYGDGPSRLAAALRPGRSRQVPRRERRPPRGPAARRRRCAPSSPTRATTRPWSSPGCRRHSCSSTTSVVDRLRLEDPRARRRGRVRARPPADHVALPVADRARVPAAVRRRGDGPGRRSATDRCSTGPSRGQAFIPVEFQMAYRFGHSMVRPSYRANFTGLGGAPFFALLFDTAAAQGPRSVRSARRRTGGRAASSAGRRSSGSRGSRPIRAPTSGSTPSSRRRSSICRSGRLLRGSRRRRWPQRNLLRHLTWSLPSGQAIAAAMGAPVLTPPATGRPGARASAVRHLDAALVLRAARGRRLRAGRRTSARSAVGSSPRCSSACCRPIPTRSCTRRAASCRRWGRCRASSG